MTEVSIDKLYAGKKYRIDINGVGTTDTIQFPFIDISVPPAINLSDLKNLVQQPPNVLNDVTKFSTQLEIPAVVASAYFTQIDLLTYTPGTASTTVNKVVKPATPGTSVITIRAKNGNFSAIPNYWVDASGRNRSGKFDITYRGGTTPITASFSSADFAVTDIASGDLVIKVTLTASTNGKYNAWTSGTITAGQVPFSLKALGPNFSPIKNILSPVLFDSASGINASVTVSARQTPTVSAPEGIYRFSLASNTNNVFINTQTVKDIFIPIWRYKTSTGLSKWYYCGYKDDSYYIPSSASKSGNTYTVDTSTYYEVGAAPNKNVRLYLGYVNVNTSSALGQPVSSSASTDIITNNSLGYGTDTSVDIYLYEGYPYDNSYPITEWHIAFAVARFTRNNDDWSSGKWINCSNSNQELNTSRVSVLSKTTSPGQMDKNDRNIFYDNPTIRFDSGGNQVVS